MSCGRHCLIPLSRVSIKSTSRIHHLGSVLVKCLVASTRTNQHFEHLCAQLKPTRPTNAPQSFPLPLYLSGAATMSEPVEKTESSPSSPSDKPEQSSSSNNLEQSSSPPTSPLPPTQQEKDCQAFVSWIRAVVSTTDDDQRTLTQHPRDLADGAWLSRVLSEV